MKQPVDKPHFNQVGIVNELASKMPRYEDRIVKALRITKKGFFHNWNDNNRTIILN